MKVVSGKLGKHSKFGDIDVVLKKNTELSSIIPCCTYMYVSTIMRLSNPETLVPLDSP